MWVCACECRGKDVRDPLPLDLEGAVSHLTGQEKYALLLLSNLCSSCFQFWDWVLSTLASNLWSFCLSVLCSGIIGVSTPGGWPLSKLKEGGFLLWFMQRSVWDHLGTSLKARSKSGLGNLKSCCWNPLLSFILGKQLFNPLQDHFGPSTWASVSFGVAVSPLNKGLKFLLSHTAFLVVSKQVILQPTRDACLSHQGKNAGLPVPRQALPEHIPLAPLLTPIP